MGKEAGSLMLCAFTPHLYSPPAAVFQASCMQSVCACGFSGGSSLVMILQEYHIRFNHVHSDLIWPFFGYVFQALFVQEPEPFIWWLQRCAVQPRTANVQGVCALQNASAGRCAGDHGAQHPPRQPGIHRLCHQRDIRSLKSG